MSRHGKAILASSLLMFFLFQVIPARAQPKSGAETAGDILQLVIPATGFAAAFFSADHEGTGQFYKSFFLNLGVTYALKYSIDRQRPAANGGHSFPSGHTSVAFQGASFIQRRYGWRYGLPAYAGAAFVGWSRIDCEMHYPSDVLAGAAIGIASSYLFTTPYPGLTVEPVVGAGFYGLGLRKAW